MHFIPLMHLSSHQNLLRRYLQSNVSTMQHRLPLDQYSSAAHNTAMLEGKNTYFYQEAFWLSSSEAM